VTFLLVIHHGLYTIFSIHGIAGKLTITIGLSTKSGMSKKRGGWAYMFLV
jgi:hypothetical protein